MTFDKYISTTLPYVNSVPHIGHSLEFIQADSIFRYNRMVKRQSVFLNIGVDEHGLKVWNKAQEVGQTPQEYVDVLAQKWEEFSLLFQIGFNEKKIEGTSYGQYSFYRTSSPFHHSRVRQAWSKYKDNGDIFKKAYTGLYCIGCESFKTEKDLVDGKCPDHGTTPAEVNEENWFFKITKYRDHLLNWLDENPDFLSPHVKTEELRNLIINCEDISISRLKKNVPWGVEVPDEPDQVMYVWFEALLNYIFAVPDYKDQYFIQFCGPDNLRFQGLIFQAFLAAANLPHTKKLLVHGMVLDDKGRKMSKTIGNVIDPLDQLNKFGLDAVRYYTLAGLTTFADGCWSEKDLIERYNTELANDYGNLIARVTHLISTKKVDLIEADREFKEIVAEKVNSIGLLWDKFEIYKALQETNALAQFGNKYIDSARPWSSDHYVSTLSNLHFLLREITILYKPVLSPATIDVIEEALKTNVKTIVFPKINYEQEKIETPGNRKKISS